MDVTTLMRKSVAINRDRPAVITEQQTVSFAQAWDRGVRLAQGLLAMGVKKGERVACLGDNNLWCADECLGCAIAGAVRVPLYARNSRDSHRDMIEGTQCVALLADAAHAASLVGLDREIASLRQVLVRDDGYEAWLQAQSAVDAMIAIDGDDWYVIRHSGGTTGAPKGVGYTHHDWVVNCRNWAYLLDRMSFNSAVGHAGPISHASGYLFLPVWLAGGSNVLFGAFEPAKVIRMMRRHGVSHMFASAPILAALATQADARSAPWPALRSLLAGGSPISDNTIAITRAAFGDVLYQAFGQTEAVPITGMGPDEWFAQVPGSTPLRSAGRVLPFAEVKICDEAGNELPVGQTGEIVAKVEGQMRGYWNNHELSQARLVDGWVHTNDVGRLDDNGYLYVLDRSDDKIVSGGFNIWPAELENVIAGHPGVIEVVVFAVPHDKWGETPMAVVRVQDLAALSEEQVVQMCRDHLGSYKKPTRVSITLEPLPRSPVGKLLRRVLREPHWAGRETRVAGT